MTKQALNFRSFQAQCSNALRLIPYAILSVSLNAFAADISADALPAGGQVVAGHATIEQSAATMNINQTSQRAVVNWQSFDVGANAQVNFNQPNAQAVTLNRVTGASASQIDGAIRANGQVIIVNSNGVSFGKGAQVDAAAVVATTMNISNQDFMDGKHVYQGNGTGKVVNEGRITAHDPKGFIALLAPEVRNEGYLVARANVANTIAMVAGEKITLNFQNNQLMGVRVDVSTINALVENKRLVFVDGGTVIVAANSARQLMNGVVRNSGVIVASSAVNNGGKIDLVAADVTNTGKLLANGKGTGATGGQINVAGENITLAAGSKIAANGDAGGGQINVGSKPANASNNEPALTAKNVRVESTAVVTASAINSGNGGMVKIHSTEQTHIHGVLSANGGTVSGNGGVIETSSNVTLVVGSTAQVNVVATNGQPGTWKLQAGQLNVDRNMANVISQTLNQGHVALTAIAQHLFAGNIHQEADAVIQKTAGANNTTLSLLADGEINIQGQIANLLNAPLTVEMVANQIKLQNTANIAAYNIGINAVSSLSIWGNLFGQGSNPFVNVLAGVFNLFGAISANNTNGQGGKVRVSANNINLNARSRIEANGQNGGELMMVASDTIEIQNAEIQTNGSNGRGGSISIAGAQKTLLGSATILAAGQEQGGHILIGNDAQHRTLPFSVYTGLDALTVINAGQINPHSLDGGFIETSGQTLGLLAAINAGRGGMWLIDPNNITISSSATSGGTLPSYTASAASSVINATDPQNKINAGTSVTIIASGTITQTANLSFAPASGVSVSLTYDTRSGTAQSITLNGTTTNTGAGDLTLNYLSSGRIVINGAINASSTGKINVVAQSFYAANTMTTCSLGACANIYNTSTGSITTKGGFVVLDATGGSVNGTTISAGTIQTGPVYLNATINTTTSGATTSSSGGHLSIAGSDAIANGVGSFEYDATLNIGGNASFQLKNYSSASYGFVVASYGTTKPITAYGNIDISITGVNANAVALIYLSSALTSTNGNINLTATSTNTTITNNPGVSSLSTGTITANAGTITINSNTYLSSAVVIAGAISAKQILITGTATTATTIVSLGAMTIVAGGSNLSVTANNSAAGANTGITQTGTITHNANGGNISFTSNNIINQTGAITLAANTSGTARTITYDTSSGDKTSSITTGGLSVTAGSNIATNYIAKASGAAITLDAISVPGYINIDNTYLSGTSLGINLSNAAAKATATGITITKNLTAGLYASTTGIKIVGVNSGASYAIAASVTSMTAQTLAGPINMTGYSTGAGASIYLTGLSLNSANGINLTAYGTTGGPINNLYMATGSITNALGDINFISSQTGPTSTYGINITHSIVQNANGGNINFVANNAINQTGNITVAANTSGVASAITYDTSSGTKASNTTTGALTITAGSTSSINYLVKTSGATIAPGAISVPGTIILDNTYGGTAGSGGSAASGYITTANAGTLATTTSSGISIASALVANNLSGAMNGITIKGISAYVNTSYSGVAIVANITSNNGDISITGIASSGAYGVYDSGGVISSAGAVNIVGTSTTGQAVSISSAINATSGITITANATTATTISTLNILSNSAGVMGLNDYLSITSGTLTFLGNVSGSTVGVPTPVAANMNGAAIGSSTLVTNFALQSSTANSATYLFAFYNGVHVKIAQVVLSRQGNAIYGYESAARYLTSGTALTNTQILSQWGTGTVYTAGSGGYGVQNLVMVPSAGDITVTANNTAGGSNTGITQSGLVTQQTNGGNISFISNNKINQTGAVTFVPNTSGATSNLTYDTTRGTNLSTIVAGALTLPIGSTSDINFTMKSAGAFLNPAAIGTSSINLPGTVTLDNTYGCTGTGCSPTRGFITASNLATLGTTHYGVQINNAIYANKTVTINGINSGGNSTVFLQSPITTANGNINITAVGTTSWVLTNGLSGVGWYSAALTASNGTINLTSTATTGRGMLFGNSTYGLLTAKAINITGTTVSGADAVYLTSMTILAGGTDINVVANTGSSSLTALYQTDQITLVSGSNITFNANGKINQSGAIAVAANTSGAVANLTYDTTRGGKDSTIVSGAMTITTGSTSDINITMKSAGANINPGAIGSTTVALPGTVTLDNTYGGSTPATGFITAANLSTYATTSAGVTINSVIYSAKAISVKGISNGAQGVVSSAIVRANTGNINFYGIGVAHRGVEQSANIIALAGNVVMTGITNSNYGIYNSNASLIQANNITLTGTATAAAGGWIVYVGALTINTTAVGGSILVTATGIASDTSDGLYQSGAITLASGSNMTFSANNTLSQNGAIAIAANTSGVVANLIYDTTRGGKLSTIVSGQMTITTGSTSDINVTMKSVGANINPGIIGSTSVALPGNVTVDNTYGCSVTGCTPASGFITTDNIATYATTSAGLTINSVIYATKNITLKGAAVTNQGVVYSAVIKSTGGDVSMTGSTTNNYGIYNSAASLITANNITLNGSASAAAGGWIVQAGALTINSTAVGGSILVTATGIASDTSDGIYQSGAITLASGSNMTFTANNTVSQNGAIAVAANTSGAVANLIYDTTRGGKLSTIVSGAMTITSGSTSDINITMKSAGANINPGAIGSTTVALPGTVTLDNTYGGSTPATGFITAANLSTYATTSAGVTINSVIYSAKAISVKGISNGAQGVVSSAIVRANTGNINFYGIGVAHRGVEYSADITALAGNVVMTGITNSNYGIYTSNAALIKANNITLNGSASAAAGGWIVQIGALTINSTAVGGSILVTATGITTDTSDGLYQSGAITLASGSNMTFSANNTLSQNGAIAIAANTSGVVANLIYDTTRGGKLSTIVSGQMTITTGSTSDINVTMKSVGANINPGIIGSTSVALPGNVTVDNTYGCSVTGCTPASGFITTDNIATYATTSAGLTINSVIYTTKNITLKGAAVTNQGVVYSAVIKSTGGDVSMTGSTTNNYGIYNSAASLITANNISMTGYATTTVGGYLAQVGPMTINSTFAGGSITVAGINATAGGGNGIYQSGAITGANGTNISFVSNNKIQQDGAITLVANTSSAVANITYDTTSGTKLSTILGVDVSVPSGSTKAVNYTMKSAGAALDPIVNVPGAIVLDNTYGCSGTGCTPLSGFINLDNASTYATTGDAVTVGALTAGTGITLRGVSHGARGVVSSGAMNSASGNVSIVGYTTAAGQRAIDFSTSSSIYAAAGNISITGAKTSAGTLTTIYLVGSSTSAPLILSASGNIDIVGYAPSSNTAVTYGSNILLAAGGNITISGNGAGGTTYGAVDLTPAVIKAGGNLTIQGSNKVNGEAVGVAGSSATGVGYGVNLTSSSSMTIAAGKVNAGTYGHINVTGTISIDATATGNSGTAFNATTVNLTSGGLMTIIGRAVTGTGIIGVNTTATSALNSAGGIAISGIGSVGGTTGHIAMLGAITNTGTTGTGITISSTFNTSVANVTNSGLNGMRITGGAGIASGTVTGGTITGLGTLTNTGGAIGLSMAQPSANAGAAGTIEAKAYFTTTNASTITNITYNQVGGVFTNASGYVSGNFIDYRKAVNYSITATVSGNYSAVYGTAYNSATANAWLQANTSVVVSGAVSTYGLVVSPSAALSVLTFNSTVGASNLNANNVQTNTLLTTNSLAATDGATVVLAGSPTYTITPAPLTITADAQSNVYGAELALGTSAFVASGLKYSDAIASVTLKQGGSASVPGTTNAGTYSGNTNGIIPSVAVAASGTSLSNYTITYASGTLTVTPAVLTYNAASATSTYGSAPSVNAGTVTGFVNSQTQGSVTTGTLTFGTTATATSNVGTYAVNGSGLTLTGAGVGNYTFAQATANATTLTITPATLTQTVTPLNVSYGATIPTLTATVTGLKNGQTLGAVTTGTMTLSTTANSSSDVGSYAVSVSGLTPNSNYVIVEDAANTTALTIDPAVLTITSTSQTMIYGNTLELGNTAYSVSGLVNGDAIGDVSLTQSGNTTVPDTQVVGTYSGSTNGILPSAAVFLSGSDTNYNIQYVAGSLTITPRPITITADAGQTKIYGNTDPTLTYSIQANAPNEGLVGSDTFAGALSRASGSDVSLYAMTQGTLANSNYTINFVSNDFEITARPITITANANQTKVYGNADPSLTYSVQANTTNAGLVGSDSFTGALSRVTGEDVGTYAISQGTLANSNYTISFESDDLAITARPITLAASSASKVYGNSDPSLVVTITSGSLGSVTVTDVLADITGTLSRTTGDNVGSYNILLGTGTKASNYNVTYNNTNAAFAISARPITITVDVGQGKIYGDADPALTYSLQANTTNAGLVGSDTFSGAISRATGENVGGYAIGQGTLANSNYTITFVSKDFAISPRPITLTATSATKRYGQSDPSLAVTIASGTLGSATVSDVLADVTGTLTRSAGEGGGSYHILLGAGTKASNYSITYNSSNAAFTISGVSITITGATGLTKTYDATTAMPSSDAGYVVSTYTVTNGVISGLPNGDTLTLVGAPVFSSADAGTVDILQGSLALSGTVANNYAINWTNGSANTISKAVLTVTANSAAKFATMSDVVGLNGLSYSGFVGGQTVANLTTEPTVSVDRASGSQLENVLDGYESPRTYNDVLQVTGGSASNYQFQYARGHYTVVPVGHLLIQVANATTAYGVTPTLTISSASYCLSLPCNGSNQIRTLTPVNQSGNTYTVNDGYGTTATFTIGATSTANSAGYTDVGNYVIGATGVSILGQNFTQLALVGTVAVDMAPLTVTPAGLTKIYDGSNTMTNLTLGLNGVMANDSISVTGSGIYSAVNAGTGLNYNLTGLALSGTNAANYYLVSGSAMSGNDGEITARPITITATANQTKVYGNNDPSLSYTVQANTTNAGLVGTDTFTGLLARDAGENVASYAIGQGTLANSNYNISFVPNSFAITARPITITAGAGQAKVYGNTDPTLTYVAESFGTSRGLMSGDSFSGLLARDVGENVASYAIGRGTLANSNYNISFVPNNFAITARPITITADLNQSKIYGNVDPTFAYTPQANTANAGLVGSDVFTGLLSRASGGDVGNYAISQGTLANSNYTINFVSKDFAISPRPITLTATATSKIYGNNDPTFAYTAQANTTDAGLVGSDTFLGSLSRVSGDDVGNYAMTQGTLANSNYTINFVSNNLVITPRPITITATPNQTKVYGNGDTTLTYSVQANTSNAGLVGGDTFAGSLTREVGEDVGNYAITQGTLANSNYDINFTANNFGITARPITITADAGQAKLYGNSDTTLTYSVQANATNAGLVGSDTFAGSMTRAVGEIVGSYAISQGTLANSNYMISFVSKDFAISPRPITLTATPATKIYGNTDPTLTYSIQANAPNEGLVGNDTFSGSSSRVSGDDVRNYAMTQGTLANSNYTINFVSNDFEITARPITITANANQTKVYGNADPSLTYSVQANTTNAGLVGSDSFTGALSRVTGEDVGTYAISQGTLANSNYTISFESDDLAITARPITLAASSASKVYGNSDPSLVVTITSGSLGSVTVTDVLADITGTLSRTTGDNVGSYNILLGTGTKASNYNVTYSNANAAFTITPRTLNVTANAQSMTYGTAFTLDTTAFTVSGLIGNDAVNSVTLLQGANAVVPGTQNAGTYSGSSNGIMPSTAVGSGLNNYAISYVPGTLTIATRPLTITPTARTSTYGDALVLGNSSFSVTGLVNNDVVSSVTLQYSNSTLVPGTLNYGSYAGAISASNATGSGLSNYAVTYGSANLSINKAVLTVTALPYAQFVGMTDTAGYAGVTYTGLKNSDVVSGAQSILGAATVSVTRTNSANSAGSYASVLQPSLSNASLSNYTVNYVAGNYTIVGANELLVQLGANTSVYGTLPSYIPANMTAAYCTNCAVGMSVQPNLIDVLTANIIVTASNHVSLDDGFGTTATFNVIPNVTGQPYSASGQLIVGNYSLGRSDLQITTTGQSANYTGVTVVGGLNVTPLQVDLANMNIAGMTKVYDGNANMSNLTVSPVGTGLLPADAIALQANGMFASKNVGANNYTLTVSLVGADAANYQVIGGVGGGSVYSGTNGSITQLNSVTYTGAPGGNWSNPNNWTTTGTNALGAIPDLSNVANVILPVGSSVVYDQSVLGPVTSAVNNNGNMTVSVSSATTLPMSISGSGTVTIANTGTVTLSGDNSYAGGTIINAAATLIAGSNNAIGNGAIVSNGTNVNPASFGAAGFVLPALTVTGGTIQLTSDIATVGAQSYADLVLAGNTTLSTTNGNISLLGRVDSAVNKTNDLVVNAGSRNVTIGNSVGSIARFNNLTVTGRLIYILADVLTGMTQTYDGDVLIGDLSYLGETPTVGFLYTPAYIPYFEYGSGNNVTGIEYLNSDAIHLRTLISEDPEITFNGMVNDLVPNTHTLLLAAIAPTMPTSGYQAVNDAAKVNFNESVGATAPLYSLNAQTVLNTNPGSNSDYLGSINITDSVATYSSQYYRANIMGAQASSPPGTVTFSVYNPAASVTYWLPTQTLANSGVNSSQMNLQNTGNPGSIDRLVINGSNNFASVANLTGLNNWGTGFVQAQALNYVAPTNPQTPSQLSQFMDYSKFIQRDVRARSMKALDDGDGEYKAVVDVGDAEVNDGGVDCASLRKQKNAVLPPECRAKNI